MSSSDQPFLSYGRQHITDEDVAVVDVGPLHILQHMGAEVQQGDPAVLAIGLPEGARDHTAHAWVEVDGADVGPRPGALDRRRLDSDAGVFLDRIQEGFFQEHGLQCGFCTPGMMMTARWLLDRNPDPAEAEIREVLSGLLCRCTGYENIVRSVRWAAQHPAGHPGESP